jgi:meso-butanediol dehydrogenase/(S,S)-butanediol dehydrogenase/diacetyl reductase
MDIDKKVAIVTGAGGNGAGRAIAYRLALEGASVVVSDVNVEGALETVRRIEGAGGRAAYAETDMRVQDQVRTLIEFAVRTFGGLSVLVNNASAPPQPGESLEHWVESVQTDLLGTMYATKFALDAMRRGGGGAIVNVASISALWHGRKSPGGFPAYDAAKAGVIRFTTMLAPLGEKENIRVNYLAPGWIASDEVRSYWESLTLEQRAERGAPSRLLQPSDIADAVVRLATDESLYGRILVWWSDDEPRLIPWADRGYATLV